MSDTTDHPMNAFPLAWQQANPQPRDMLLWVKRLENADFRLFMEGIHELFLNRMQLSVAMQPTGYKNTDDFLHTHGRLQGAAEALDKVMCLVTSDMKTLEEWFHDGSPREVKESWVDNPKI